MATIRDVAREAGVSIATVSRVYNNTGLVSSATLEHVREVAGRMDYWPNSAARSLITSRSHALGVILPELYGEFFSEVIRGIDLAARKEKYQVLVSSSHADTEVLVQAIRAMRGRIDGLIAMAPNPEHARAIREFTRSFPVVLLDPGISVEECGSVSIANYDGAFSMVRHLLGLGHTLVAHVAGPAENVDASERLRGWRTALAEAQLECGEDLLVHGDFSESSGYKAVARILARSPRPTAIFAANDYMAIGVISALRDAGLRVPQDVAVTGFDDIALARFLEPPLTTVRVEASRLGSKAVQMLLPITRTRRAALLQPQLLPASLVIRSSCGTPPVRRADVRERQRGTRGERGLLPARDDLQRSGFQDASAHSDAPHRDAENDL